MNIARCCGLAVLLWAADVSIAEAQCSYTLNPTSFTVGGTASAQTLSVISGTSCSWTATTRPVGSPLPTARAPGSARSRFPSRRTQLAVLARAR